MTTKSLHAAVLCVLATTALVAQTSFGQQPRPISGPAGPTPTQLPTQGTGAISGVITDGSTGKPVAGATFQHSGIRSLEFT